jgi:hypothetical protein
MSAEIREAGISISKVHRSDAGVVVFDGVVTFDVKGGDIEFNYAYHFKDTSDLTWAIKNGVSQLTQTLVDLHARAQNYQVGQ